MTVIVYSKGVLAADTKAVDENGQIFKCQKLHKLPNGTLVGTSGDADQRDILALLGKSSITKLPTKARLASTKTESKGLWIHPTGEIFSVEVEYKSGEESSKEWSAEVFQIQEGYAATGSGASYALGAVLAGKSAVEAVRIACKLDNGCGMPVEHLILERQE